MSKQYAFPKIAKSFGQPGKAFGGERTVSIDTIEALADALGCHSLTCLMSIKSTLVLKLRDKRTGGNSGIKEASRIGNE